MMTVGRRKLAGVSRRLRDSSQAFATVQRNPTLRRALLAFGFAWTAEWAFTVALGVVAFRNGGATAVGMVAFARMAPAALLAPISIAVAGSFRARPLIGVCEPFTRWRDCRRNSDARCQCTARHGIRICRLGYRRIHSLSSGSLGAAPSALQRPARAHERQRRAGAARLSGYARRIPCCGRAHRILRHDCGSRLCWSV